MTNTTTLAPTNAEILDLWADVVAKRRSSDDIPVVVLVRDALAKWGAPAPASGAAEAGLRALADRIEEAQGRAICISVEGADYLRNALAASAPVAPAPQPAAPQGDGVPTWQAAQDPMLECSVQPRPLSHPLAAYHSAMSKGPLHYTWQDKPHRLVYDLIAAVKHYANQAGQAAPADPYHDGVNIESLQRACRALGLRTDDSLEAFVSPDVHADHVNRLTRAVVKYVLTRPAPPQGAAKGVTA